MNISIALKAFLEGKKIKHKHSNVMYSINDYGEIEMCQEKSEGDPLQFHDDTNYFTESLDDWEICDGPVSDYFKRHATYKVKRNIFD
jgi:hypothetical protein